MIKDLRLEILAMRVTWAKSEGSPSPYIVLYLALDTISK